MVLQKPCQENIGKLQEFSKSRFGTFGFGYFFENSKMAAERNLFGITNAENSFLIS